MYARYTKPVFGEDVVYAAEPKKRNQQMQHMAYGLRTARLKSYVGMVEKETRNFLKSWGESVRDLDAFYASRVRLSHESHVNLNRCSAVTFLPCLSCCRFMPRVAFA